MAIAPLVSAARTCKTLPATTPNDCSSAATTSSEPSRAPSSKSPSIPNRPVISDDESAPLTFLRSVRIEYPYVMADARRSRLRPTGAQAENLPLSPKRRSLPPATQILLRTAKADHCSAAPPSDQRSTRPIRLLHAEPIRRGHTRARKRRLRARRRLCQRDPFRALDANL